VVFREEACGLHVLQYHCAQSTMSATDFSKLPQLANSVMMLLMIETACLHSPIQTANGYSISRRIAGLWLLLVCIGSFCKGKEKDNETVARE